MYLSQGSYQSELNELLYLLDNISYTQTSSPLVHSKCDRKLHLRVKIKGLQRKIKLTWAENIVSVEILSEIFLCVPVWFSKYRILKVSR